MHMGIQHLVWMGPVPDPMGNTEPGRRVPRSLGALVAKELSRKRVRTGGL